MSRESASAFLARSFALDMTLPNNVIACISAPSRASADRLWRSVCAGEFGLFTELIGLAGGADAPGAAMPHFSDLEAFPYDPATAPRCSKIVLPPERHSACPSSFLRTLGGGGSCATIVYFWVREPRIVRMARQIVLAGRTSAGPSGCDRFSPDCAQCTARLLHVECAPWMGGFSYICRSNFDLAGGFGRIEEQH
jgi:hypothetical protein